MIRFESLLMPSTVVSRLLVAAACTVGANAMTPVAKVGLVASQPTPSGPVLCLGRLEWGGALVGGAFSSFSNLVRGDALVRLLADGAPDRSYRAFGDVLGLDGTVHAVAIAETGVTYLGGDFESINGQMVDGLARLKESGAVDSSFVASGLGAGSLVLAIAVDLEGGVFIGGELIDSSGRLTPLLAFQADGNLKTSFVPLIAADEGTARVNAIVCRSDGTVLVGGRFDEVGGKRQANLARLRSDGTMDETDPLRNGTDGEVWCLRKSPNGQCLIGGDFASLGGLSRLSGLARLKADGSLDRGFVPRSGAGAPPLSGIIHAVEVTSGGRIVVGGEFRIASADPAKNLAWFSEDGVLIGTLSGDEATKVADGPVLALCQLGDNELLIGGEFRSPAGDQQSYLLRAVDTGSAQPTVALDPPAIESGSTGHYQLVLRARASDADGIVTRVEFWDAEADRMLGMALGEPYQVKVANLAPGPTTVQAWAFDETGLMARSQATFVKVPGSLPWIGISVEEGGLVLRVDATGGASSTVRIDWSTDLLQWKAAPIESSDSSRATWRGVPTSNGQLYFRAVQQ